MSVKKMLLNILYGVISYFGIVGICLVLLVWTGEEHDILDVLNTGWIDSLLNYRVMALTSLIMTAGLSVVDISNLESEKIQMRNQQITEKDNIEKKKVAESKEAKEVKKTGVVTQDTFKRPEAGTQDTVRRPDLSVRNTTDKKLEEQLALVRQSRLNDKQGG